MASLTFRMTSRSRALIGVVIFAAFVAFKVARLGGEEWSHAALLFAALVIVPLLLDLLVERNDAREAARWLGWIRAWQLPAAILLVGSYWLTPRLEAALLALPWAALTALMAATGIVRALRHGWARPLGRLSADVGMVYLVVGGLWILAERVGFAPLHFPTPIVMLTAVHFHYAGLLLPIFAGLVQRRFPDSRGVARVIVATVLAVPAVAVGITIAQLGWGGAVEAAAGLALAAAGMSIGIFHVRVATEPALPIRARLLLGIAGASLFFAMVLAALYALRGQAIAVPRYDFAQMRVWHGTVNAIGFGLCGVLGWRALSGTK
jgi:hypothetical protein